MRFIVSGFHTKLGRLYYLKLLYILYLGQCNPSGIFRKHSSKLCNAIEADFLRIANGLNADELISPYIINNVTTMTGTAYERANIIVRDIQRKLDADDDPVQLLLKICDFLQKQGDKILIDIGDKMMSQL